MDFLIVLVAAATNIDFTVIIKVIKLSSKKGECDVHPEASPEPWQGHWAENREQVESTLKTQDVAAQAKTSQQQQTKADEKPPKGTPAIMTVSATEEIAAKVAESLAKFAFNPRHRVERNIYMSGKRRRARSGTSMVATHKRKVIKDKDGDNDWQVESVSSVNLDQNTVSDTTETLTAT